MIILIPFKKISLTYKKIIFGSLFLLFFISVFFENFSSHLSIRSIDLLFFTIKSSTLGFGLTISMITGIFIFSLIIFYNINNTESPLFSYDNSIALIFTICLINDSLVGLKLYDFIIISPFSFTLGIIIISHKYQTQMVSLYREVEELNIQLEEKISDGTMELLFSEFGIKSYIDTINSVTGSKHDFVDSDAIQNLLDYNKASSLLSLIQELEMISGEDELMDKLISRVMHITSASTGILFLLNDNGDMEIKASKNPEGLVSYNFDLVEKTLQDQEWKISKGGSEGNEIYVLTVPITSGSKNIGVCYLENTLDISLFSENIAQTIHAFMSQASLALENIRLKNTKIFKEKKENLSLTDDISEKLQIIKEYIDEHYSSDISREGLAAMVDIHPDTLSRAFKSFSGKKLHDYINTLRIHKAAKLLRETESNIISIAYDSGFESLTTFNRTFMKIMKKTPTEYRKD